MFNTDDYAVGWICAIDHEYNAARVMLDSIDETTTEIFSDYANDYTLGRIGGHNVVITMLITNGSSSTDDSARRMMQRFPSIKFVLLVGLGTRATNKQHKIKLGDVVVGSALVQYTTTNTVQHPNPSFKPQTSCQMRTNLIGHEAGFGGDCINRTIRSILKKGSLLQCMLNQNQLDLGNYGLGSAEDNIPDVHYGLVASINGPSTNGHTPSDFARHNDFLCFTAHSQWAPDDIHCAVIRGICEYSDIRKGASCQQNAAMTAAAYAKNLLLSQDVFLQTLLPATKHVNLINNIKFELDGILGSSKINFEHVHKPRRFFRVGRVFAMIWTEPTLDRQENQAYHPNPIKSQVFSEIRRFIVVHQSYRASICIPIHTYGGKGIQKRDIRVQDHARLYSFENEPPALDEGKSLREPIGIVIEGNREARRLHPESLVNFGKVYTVEHGADVMNIGYVHKSHGQRLGLSWEESNINEQTISNTGSEENGKCSACVEKKIMMEKESQDNTFELTNGTLKQKISEGQVIGLGGGSNISSRSKGGSDMHVDHSKPSRAADRPPLTSEERGAKRSKRCVNSKHEDQNNNFQYRTPEDCRAQGWDEVECSKAAGSGVGFDEITHGSATETWWPMNGARSEYYTNLKGNEEYESDEDGGFDGSDNRSNSHQHFSWACPFFRLDPAQYLRCGLARLKRFSDIIQHIKREHTESTKEYHCTKCFSVFQKQAALDDHVSGCTADSPREFFYHSEFEELRNTLRLPIPELRTRLKGKIPSDLSNGEIKWVYIWQTHFSNDAPGSAFLNDIVFEIADVLRRRNEKDLGQIISNSQLDFREISRTAYTCAPLARSYWLYHPREPNATSSNANDPSSQNSNTLLRAIPRGSRDNGQPSNKTPAQVGSQRLDGSKGSAKRSVQKSSHIASLWNTSEPLQAVPSAKTPIDSKSSTPIFMRRRKGTFLSSITD